jgi:hypothetical protein
MYVYVFSPVYVYIACAIPNPAFGGWNAIGDSTQKL